MTPNTMPMQATTPLKGRYLDIAIQVTDTGEVHPSLLAQLSSHRLFISLSSCHEITCHAILAQAIPCTCGGMPNEQGVQFSNLLCCHVFHDTTLSNPVAVQGRESQIILGLVGFGSTTPKITGPQLMKMICCHLLMSPLAKQSCTGHKVVTSAIRFTLVGSPLH